MHFAVRVLTEKDAQAMRTLRLHGLKNDAFAFAASFAVEAQQPLSFFEQRCTEPDSTAFFGAFVEDNLVGITSIVRESSPKTQHYAWVHAVYTHPDYRAFGVSTSLLDAVIYHAKSWQGVDFLQLGVATINSAAIHIYQKAGFKPWGTQPSALRVEGTDYDELHMILDIRRH